MPANVPTFAQPCPSCDGFGRAVVTGPRHTARRPATRIVTCTACRGRGKR
ncbi:hypothetical protein [Yinghuangia sp. YIM S09857]